MVNFDTIVELHCYPLPKKSFHHFIWINFVKCVPRLLIILHAASSSAFLSFVREVHMPMYPGFLLGWQSFSFGVIRTPERSLRFKLKIVTRFPLLCEEGLGVKSLVIFNKGVIEDCPHLTTFEWFGTFDIDNARLAKSYTGQVVTPINHQGLVDCQALKVSVLSRIVFTLIKKRTGHVLINWANHRKPPRLWAAVSDLLGNQEAKSVTIR